MPASAHAQTFARLIEAFNDRDIEAWSSRCTEDVEHESRFSRVGGATYRGKQAIATWWEDLDDAWDPITVELEEIADVGPDKVVVLMTLHGKGRKSGLALDEPVAVRVHWRGELLKQMEYMDREEAEMIVRGSR